MYNTKLLIIIKVFENLRYYLKKCKNDFWLLTNHNNLYQFIDIKNLS